MTYKTPGVYVEEISIFPPSVAEVETAIPAFIGYTEKADENGTDLTNVPTKVSSLLEYAEFFGGAPTPGTITVVLNSSNAPTSVTIAPQYYLYNSLRLFYDNGGGDCYIVSVGDYEETVGLGDVLNPDTSPGFLVGLDALKKYDEPTIILFPDAISLSTNAHLYSLQQQALAQCASLQDRVCVFDLYEADAGNANFDWEEGVDEFRDNIGINNLKYGAAYVPHLKTTIPYSFSYNDVGLMRGGAPLDLATISADPVPVNNLANALLDKAAIGLLVSNPLGAGPPPVTLTDGYEAIATTGEAEVTSRITYIEDVAQVVYTHAALNDTSLNTLLTQLVATGGALNTLLLTLHQYDIDYFDDTVAAPTPDPIEAVLGTNYNTGGRPYDFSGNSVTAPGSSIYSIASNVGDTENARADNARDDLQLSFEALVAQITALHEAACTQVTTLETELKSANSIWANTVLAIEAAGSTLPSSGAIVGVYTKVDDTRGVWKAPANVSLNSVTGPTVVIDDNEQADLNVDVNAGKSVNAIRPFTGKGTLVWGARTLAGNDNEWRYVPVRRFFNMVEESVKKSTAWAVFEPNDAGTWLRVKTMIDNYLFQKWQEGALAGAKPDEAFFVHVGLGKTMTAQDILEGRMIVKIGMAVVRPAEFIILQFSHKLQES